MTPPPLPKARELFLQSLRDCAQHSLAKSQRWSHWRLHDLVMQCAAELRVDPDTLWFLIGDVRDWNPRESYKSIKDDWDSILADAPGSSRRRIVVLVPDGQSIRTFLYTDVLKEMCGWADVIVLSPLDIGSKVAALGPNALFLPVPNIRRNRFDVLMGYLGYLHTGSPTTQRFTLRLDEQLDKALQQQVPLETPMRLWQIGKALSSEADYIRSYCWSLRFFAHLNVLAGPVRLLRRLKPDLVFNTNSVPWPTRPWTRAAALAGVPVVSNVISWDNMSTKTLLDEFAETYLIWSDEMDEDFETTVPFLRDVPRVIVGSPQFEPIIQGRGLVPRAQFLHSHGLDPDKKLVLYTTGSKTLFPREAECLDALLSHWREHMEQRVNIMVRMHPKDREGRYEAVREKFPEVPFTLAGPTLTEQDDWVPTEDDIALLVNQLNHCDVVVNVASTMTLEGFSVDKPSINIGFTLGLSISQRYPMEDYYKSRHYREIIDTGAARWVANYEELFAALDDVLDNGTYDVQKQRRVLHMKCRHIEDSSKRINAFLSDFTARAKPA